MGIELAIGAALAPVIGGSITTVGGVVVGVGGLAATVAAGITSVGFSLVTTGLSIGLNALNAAKAKAGALVTSPALQNRRQSTPRTQYCYGTAAVGGAFLPDKANPPYLITQMLIHQGRINAVNGVIINGVICEFNENGDAVTPEFNKNGQSYLKISTRLGDDDQAVDPLLLSEFPDTDTNFRQRGITTVTLRAFFGTDNDDHRDTWGASVFTPTIIIQGRLIYDPRDSSQDQDDETTWKWSDNWALCLADWMRAPFGGRKRSDQIDYDAVAAMADFCDEPVSLKNGGTEKRYTMNGAFTSDQDPFGVLEGMLKGAGQASAIWSRGKFKPLADLFRRPVATITQDDLVGGFEFVTANGRRESLNVVNSEYISADRKFSAAVSPALVRDDLIATDGERLEAQILRPFTQGAERAQRLDKITLERSRLGRSISMPVSLRHLALEPGDNVNVEFSDFPNVNGVYTVARTGRDMQSGTISLGLVEDDPATVHTWNPATEVQETVLSEAA